MLISFQSLIYELLLLGDFVQAFRSKEKIEQLTRQKCDWDPSSVVQSQQIVQKKKKKEECQLCTHTHTCIYRIRGVVQQKHFQEAKNPMN